jgi:hypothetical protein
MIIEFVLRNPFSSDYGLSNRIHCSETQHKNARKANHALQIE